MQTSRWPGKVWQNDRVTKTNVWVNDVKYIWNSVNLKDEHHLSEPVDIEYVSNMLLSQARAKWKDEADTKSKLRTFVNIHDFDNVQGMVKVNLSHSQGSILTKFKAEVLPIRFETGRFKGLGPELRIC